MERHFQRELEQLRTTLIRMASAAEEALRLAMRSVLTRDASLAGRIIAGDGRINQLEIETDYSIIDLLALQQPVAIDLRIILAAQKINNDLERIGDHAVNIAQSALALAGMPPVESYLELPTMGELAERMLHDALDGFIHVDADLGRAVLTHDDTIDELNRKMVQQVIAVMKEDPSTIEVGMELIRLSRNLERVADLATNIAEDVIFMAQARVVKHHAEDEGSPPG